MCPRTIYSEFISGKRESEIAATLNSQGVQTDLGRAWTRGTVHQVLTNEKYIGNNVYNRTSFKLKKKQRQQHAGHVGSVKRGLSSRSSPRKNSSRLAESSRYGPGGCLTRRCRPA